MPEVVDSVCGTASDDDTLYMSRNFASHCVHVVVSFAFCMILGMIAVAFADHNSSEV